VSASLLNDKVLTVYGKRHNLRRRQGRTKASKEILTSKNRGGSNRLFLNGLAEGQKDVAEDSFSRQSRSHMQEIEKTPDSSATRTQTDHRQANSASSLHFPTTAYISDQIWACSQTLCHQIFT
jgi:hypothetical protein